MAGAYYEEPVEPVVVASNFSHGKTILVLAIVVGCFAVLWPKIFYPMLFGSQPDRQEDPIAGARATHRQFPGGGQGPGAMPGSEFLHPAMRERGKMAGMTAMPEVGARPPIRTVDKEWGGRGGPMPGMRPTMGGPGIQAQQPRGSGTMGVIMPIYTVGIIIFFVYTTMKILFKNKDNEDEEDEYTQKRRREMKFRQEEESEYSRYAQNFNKLNKRPQEFIEKDRKNYILDKEVASPHARIEEINQMVNNLKQETAKQVSAPEVIPMGCAKTLMDPQESGLAENAMKPSPENAMKPSPENTMKPSPENAMKPSPENVMKPSPENAMKPSPENAMKSSPENAMKPSPTDTVTPDAAKSENVAPNEDIDEISARQDAAIEEVEAETIEEVNNGQIKSGMINQKKESEIMDREEASLDPRDLEICLLKKRLEETEKAMERIMTCMGTVTQHLLPQALEATLHPNLQTNCEPFRHEITDNDGIEEQHSTNQEDMENDMTETSDDTDSNNETYANETNNNQILE